MQADSQADRKSQTNTQAGRQTQTESHADRKSQTDSQAGRQSQTGSQAVDRQRSGRLTGMQRLHAGRSDVMLKIQAKVRTGGHKTGKHKVNSSEFFKDRQNTDSHRTDVQMYGHQEKVQVDTRSCSHKQLGKKTYRNADVLDNEDA